MYKQRRPKSGRYNKTPNSYGRGRRSGNNWKNKNLRQHRENISHSRYISSASSAEKIEKYIPQNNFYEFGLDIVLTQNISDVGYVNPTKIQDLSIPEILKGKDLLGIASTGSGKTAAFLIPMINKALEDQKTKILIICPTRELANQISIEFKKFAKGTSLQIVLVMGGKNINQQIRLLNQRPQFVVATPGRLMDVEKRRKIDLGTFNTVVLDEVDRMLDMGFVNDIKMLIAKLAPKRQSLFFSATLSPKEESIASSILNTPVRIETQKQSPLKTINQDIVKVRNRDHKLEVLRGLLKKSEFHKVLVFSRTKREAETISKELRKTGVRVGSLHGNKSQNARSKVLGKFRRDEIDVLIATDVASRGIDVPNISHVINFDEPANYNDYIHRIGRTGRIGKKGSALTFVLSSN